MLASLITSLRPLFRPFVALGLSLALSGCAGLADAPTPPPERLDEALEKATSALMAAHPELANYDPLIPTTVVDVDDLNRSSTLGRLASEIVAAELTEAGLRVREVRLRGRLYIEEYTGELMLSRLAQRLGIDQGARSLLVGTYAVGEQRLYLTLRIVRVGDGNALAATQLSLPLTNDLRAMLDRW
ncbi:FlgO family outer membrane protein [Halomonas getboli]|uniref:FlgO family outer membrane protein n=1 Tax=Halomonas getboli TaxID=2935862 RepID=UPI00200020BC|nr:FlgO family outer membrane protein [Halomonas getboli]MCK2184447.1 FlgO family outer membrane protein [Halomonas getboli]